MLLCAPPNCHPATHFLGCCSLRTGATVVLALDATYGLVMVVLHALMLGEIKEPKSELSGGISAMPRMSSFATGHPEHADDQKTAWWLQFADLDFGFGHQLFGLPDQTNIVCGLLWGIVVLLGSAYALQAIYSDGDSAKVARWFTNFFHFQLLLYVFISLVKLPKLCSPIQEIYLTHLYMECNVLWFVYIQRVILMVILASF